MSLPDPQGALRGPTGAALSRVAELADATPASRERLIDLLRVASIVAVVFGHWFIGVIWWRDGKIGTVSAIGLTSWLWIATWFLQVIPVSFFVGGFSNFMSHRSFRERGRTTAEFLWARAVRL